MSLNTDPISAALSVHYSVQDIAARNIANLETPGFKRVLACITSAADSDGDNVVESPQFAGIKLDLSQGSLKHTDNVFDLAVNGDGFFTIDTENGLRYTRNGTFRLDHDRILTTQRGDKVLGTGGEIQIPENTISIVISRAGEILADGAALGTLRITRFQHPDQIKQAGGSQYAGDNAGAENVSPGDPNVKVLQGYLEQSNVNSITELVEMLASFREYEACARSLRAIEETASQLYSWAQS